MQNILELTGTDDLPGVNIQQYKKLLRLELRQMYRLLGRKSDMSLNNKIFVYKTALTPSMWTNGINTGINLTIVI